LAIQPRSAFTLRGLDEVHLAVLKGELVSPPTSCGKPMLVIARGLSNTLHFDTKDLDSYELEVIRGNHRREVISQKIATFPDAETKELYKFVYVQIYAGELFTDCAHTLEHSGNRMSIKPVVEAGKLKRTQT